MDDAQYQKHLRTSTTAELKLELESLEKQANILEWDSGLTSESEGYAEDKGLPGLEYDEGGALPALRKLQVSERTGSRKRKKMSSPRNFYPSVPSPKNQTGDYKRRRPLIRRRRGHNILEDRSSYDPSDFDFEFEIPDFTQCSACEQDAVSREHSTCTECGRVFHNACLTRSPSATRPYQCLNCKASLRTARKLGLRKMNDLKIECLDELDEHLLELAHKQTEKDARVNENRSKMTKIKIAKENAVKRAQRKWRAQLKKKQMEIFLTFKKDVARVQSDLSKKTTLNSVLKQRAIDERTRAEKLNAKNNELQKKLSIAEAQEKELRSRLSGSQDGLRMELKKEQDRVRQFIKVFKAKDLTLRETVQKLGLMRKENADLKRQNEGLQEDKEKKIIGLQEELEKETAEVEEKTKVLKELEVKCKKLGRQVFSSSNHYDVKAARCEDLEKQLSEARRANEQIREKLREATTVGEAAAEAPPPPPSSVAPPKKTTRTKRRKRKKDTTIASNTESNLPVEIEESTEAEAKIEPQPEKEVEEKAKPMSKKKSTRKQGKDVIPGKDEAWRLAKLMSERQRMAKKAKTVRKVKGKPVEMELSEIFEDQKKSDEDDEDDEDEFDEEEEPLFSTQKVENIFSKPRIEEPVFAKPKPVKKVKVIKQVAPFKDSKIFPLAAKPYNKPRKVYTSKVASINPTLPSRPRSKRKRSRQSESQESAPKKKTKPVEQREKKAFFAFPGFDKPKDSKQPSKEIAKVKVQEQKKDPPKESKHTKPPRIPLPKRTKQGARLTRDQKKARNKAITPNPTQTSSPPSSPVTKPSSEPKLETQESRRQSSRQTRRPKRLGVAGAATSFRKPSSCVICHEEKKDELMSCNTRSCSVAIHSYCSRPVVEYTADWRCWHCCLKEERKKHI